MIRKKIEIERIRFTDSLAHEFADAKQEIFVYRNEDDGKLVEVQMAFGEMMEREEMGGFIKISKNSMARRAIEEELRREGMTSRERKQISKIARWPMVSVTAGVNPSQCNELRSFWKEHGVTGCEVLKNGDIKYDSRASRKADHEARGLFDRDAGYGDAMPRNL